MINRDILENQVKYSYISIGSNLGNRKGNIEKAKFLINQNHIKIIKISSIYESLAWPNNNDPKFFNLVIKVSTFLNPTELLRSLKFIEKKMGRKKAPKNSPRICDIDIIDYNGKKFKNSYLEIPHPRMKKRDFVLLPLMEICSNWTYPRSKMKISSILNNISEKNLTSIKIL